MRKVKSLFFTLLALLYVTAANALIVNDKFTVDGITYQVTKYGAQNEAYKMMEGRKVGKVVSLQRVMRGLMVEAPQNETFTLV